MAAAIDRYSYTATGILGDKRSTMLENVIHQRAQLAKPKSHCHHVPTNMTMGISTGRDYTALPKVFSWTDSPGGSSLLSRPKQCSQKDYVTLNREAARSGYATMRENRDFRALHDFRVKPATHESHLGDAATHHLPPDFSYGVSTRPSTPIQELMAHRFQNDWIREQVTAHQAKAAATPKKPFETRASMLRSYLLPGEQEPGALWKMPRFERRAKSRLDTFRSERQRSLAFELHGAEQSDRLGHKGLGLYIPSTK